MLTRWIIVGAVVSAASLAFAEQSVEQKAIQEMYGEKIKAAKATSTDEDDVEIATQMLIAAGDSANGQKLRLALAQTALDLTTPLGTDAAATLARRSLDLAHGIQPYKDLEKAGISRDIAAAQLARAQTDRRPAGQLSVLAHVAAKAQLTFAELAAQDANEGTKADAALKAARAIIEKYAVKDLQDDLDAAEKSARKITERRTKIQGALARLATAQESHEDSGIKTAKRAVAQVYLECDGDLASAAKYLAGTGDPWEQPVTATAAFAADPAKLDKSNCVATLDGMSKVLPLLPADGGKKKVGDIVMKMCETFLATPQLAEADSIKGRLVLAQLQAALGQTNSDKYRDKLGAAYGGINCRLEVIDGDHVALKYDFAKKEQFKDWDIVTGQWDVVQGVLACRTDKNSNWNNGEVANKFRFRPDQPLKVTFTASAKCDVTLIIKTMFWGGKELAWGQDRWTCNHFDGISCDAFGNSWRDSKTKMGEGQSYKYEIELDGAGGFKWSVNGTLVREFTKSKDKEKPAFEPRMRGSYVIHLKTDTADKGATAFSDLTIDGTILPTPDWAPAGALDKGRDR